MSKPKVTPKGARKLINRRQSPEQARQQRLDNMRSKQAKGEIAVTIKWIDRDLWRRIKMSAVRQDRIISDVVTEALTNYLNPNPRTAGSTKTKETKDDS
ncbi:MAG: hypothetical protein U9N84_06095 [Actinomycetota bacterium]|nr:hypothetical protein [Actinomycetota bacterium]